MIFTAVTYFAYLSCTPNYFDNFFILSVSSPKWSFVLSECGPFILILFYVLHSLQSGQFGIFLIFFFRNGIRDPFQKSMKQILKSVS